MRSANPMLNDTAFERAEMVVAKPMTLQGTVNKTGLLLLMVFFTAIFTWNLAREGSPTLTAWVWGGAIGGLILGLVTAFKPVWSPVTAPLYALVEGLFLGGISAMYEKQFDGIVLQAMLLTFGTLFALLGVYSMRLIHVTHNFKLGVAAATGGICIVYLATIVLGMFGIQIPFIHDAGLVGIGFSLFVVVIAALNLVLDFDFIENGCEQGAPKYMEWYAAFGLLVTLVWLYLEILRLLSKLSRRD